MIVIGLVPMISVTRDAFVNLMPRVRVAKCRKFMMSADKAASFQYFRK
jgi:hypothetical protein